MPSLIQLLNLKNIKMVLRNMWKVGPITTARYVISDMLFEITGEQAGLIMRAAPQRLA